MKTTVTITVTATAVVETLPSGASWRVEYADRVRYVDRYHGDWRCTCRFDQAAPCEHVQAVLSLLGVRPVATPELMLTLLSAAF
jgi:hypothetical protein